MLLCYILLISALVGDTLEDDITPTSPEEYYLEGSRVKIPCNYKVIADILLCYGHYSGSGLQFLYLVTTVNNPYELRADPQDILLSVILNRERTSVYLEISSAEVTDCFVVLCTEAHSDRKPRPTSQKPDSS